MHEIGVASSILEIVIKSAEDNEALAVTKVGLKVGALAGVDESSLEFALNALKEGTIAADAEFVLELIPAVGICGECGKESSPDTFFSICDHCNSPTLEIVSGKEFNISYIDIE